MVMHPSRIAYLVLRLYKLKKKKVKTILTSIMRAIRKIWSSYPSDEMVVGVNLTGQSGCATVTQNLHKEDHVGQTWNTILMDNECKDNIEISELEAEQLQMQGDIETRMGSISNGKICLSFQIWQDRIQLFTTQTEAGKIKSYGSARVSRQTWQ